ncbi:MAG: hypothetical protein KIS96_14225 [Bauldia sp.]|nr:hypothetical protein [Bauldia sp.]
MRRFLTAAALLSGTALVAVPAANAIDIGVDVGLDVDAVIGVGAGEDGISVDAGAGVGADVDAGADADAGAAVDAGAGAVIVFEGDDGATSEVSLDTLLNASVWTDDDVAIGTVVELDTASDGEAVLIVDLNDGYVEGVDRIAVRASAAVATDAGLKIRTTDEDLKASLTANLDANADAAVDID